MKNKSTSKTPTLYKAGKENLLSRDMSVLICRGKYEHESTIMSCWTYSKVAISCFRPLALLMRRKIRSTRSARKAVGSNWMTPAYCESTNSNNNMKRDEHTIAQSKRFHGLIKYWARPNPKSFRNISPVNMTVKTCPARHEMSIPGNI